MREYHYVLTVQWTNYSGGTTTASSQGVYTPPAGATRADVLNLLLDIIRAGHRAKGADSMPGGDQFSIICWELEPNELEDARA